MDLSEYVACKNRCGRPKGSGTRGLCWYCYNKLNKQVRKGTLTWEQAEKDGLCNPKCKGKPKKQIYL